ncbi:abortive infection family protein [Paenisporosarcina macmurdoensis]|uniref:Abortive infection family protein n=1 Tax=Paenisporosarcina macmurdoensis TaxID=212659 RepID=A0ABW1L800_9BACL
MNNTIELLDEVKIGLRKTFEANHNNNNYSANYYNEFVSDKDLRQCLIIMRKLAKEEGKVLSEELTNCRTVEEFIDQMYLMNDAFMDSMVGVSNLFNEYSNYLEDNMYHVEIVKIECDVPVDLTYQNIVRDLNNCDKRIADKDYSGAITSAKTLVEGVCKEILNILGEDISVENYNLPKLFNHLSKHLNLDSSNKSFEKSLKEITTGLTKVIQGLAEVRNLSSDSHSKTVNPSFHHAVLAVNSAKTVTSFLFHTYEYQKEKGILQTSLK